MCLPSHRNELGFLRSDRFVGVPSSTFVLRGWVYFFCVYFLGVGFYVRRCATDMCPTPERFEFVKCFA
jgi:hypothetical protein